MKWATAKQNANKMWEQWRSKPASMSCHHGERLCRRGSSQLRTNHGQGHMGTDHLHYGTSEMSRTSWGSWVPRRGQEQWSWGNVGIILTMLARWHPHFWVMSSLIPSLRWKKLGDPIYFRLRYVFCEPIHHPIHTDGSKKFGRRFQSPGWKHQNANSEWLKSNALSSSPTSSPRSRPYLRY